MYFEGEEHLSSIKCKCPPGGQSNFKFIYEDAKPDKCNFRKYPDTKNGYNILNLEAKENCCIESNVPRNCSKKMNYDCGKGKCNIFHNEFPAEAQQPSIKVTQMPGGNSRVRYANS